MTAAVVAALGEAGLARALGPSADVTGRLVIVRIPTVADGAEVAGAVARMTTDSHRGDAPTRGRQMPRTVPGVMTGKAQKTGTGLKRGVDVGGQELVRVN